MAVQLQSLNKPTPQNQNPKSGFQNIELYYWAIFCYTF